MRKKKSADEWKIRLLPPLFLRWQPKKETSKQIAVLMSGGVDSSVTAHLLAEQGWEVLGITMNIPTPCIGTSNSCCGIDAAFVCNKLGLPHYFVDVTKAFCKLILEAFRLSYKQYLHIEASRYHQIIVPPAIILSSLS